MCVFCGTPDPSHDLLLMRGAVLAVGAGGILAPRKWFAALRRLPATLAPPRRARPEAERSSSDGTSYTTPPRRARRRRAA